MNSKDNTQGALKIKIDIDDIPTHTCPKCSHSAFYNAIEIKIISPIMSESGKTEILRIPVVICSMCGRKILANDLEKVLLEGKKENKNALLQ